MKSPGKITVERIDDQWVPCVGSAGAQGHKSRAVIVLITDIGVRGLCAACARHLVTQTMTLVLPEAER